MERRWLFWGIVAGVAMLTFFLGLGSAQLFDEDEPKNAECGREMFARGDWIVPTFNDELRTDKPILVYWLMLSAYHLFGVTEFAARFWSAALGVGTCLVTYNIGRVLFSREAGMWAGVILATTLMFTTIARASTPDSTLIFFTTLAIFLFVRLGNLTPNADASLTWRDRLPKSTGALIAIYSVMAIAVLAKGPVGVLLPCAVIGFFLYASAVNDVRAQAAPEHCTRRSRLIGFLKRWFQPAEFFRIAWAMRPYWIVLCLLVIALPWYVAVGIQTNGAWLEGFLGHHNVGRFLKPMEGHSGPVLYYPIAILIGFFPWSILTLPVVRGIVYKLKRDTPEYAGLLFVMCWFTVYVVFFTFARTKLPNYVLPCYPAIALMAGWWLKRAVEEGAFSLVSRDFTWACWSLMLVGVVMMIGLGVAASILLPGEELLAVVGLVPFLGGIAVWQTFKRRGLRPAQLMLAGASVLFILTVFVVAAPRISRHQDGAFLADQLERRRDPVAPVATYNYFPPGLVFYAKRPIERFRVPAEIPALLSEKDGVLITRADRLEELRPLFPEGTEVIARRRRFLRRHDIVILGRPDTATPQIASGSQDSKHR